MKNIFGDSATNAVYYHLQERYLLKREAILKSPETFVKAVREIFGEAGADVIEALLVKDLCIEFGVNACDQQGKFADCMNKLKGMLIEEKQV